MTESMPFERNTNADDEIVMHPPDSECIDPRDIPPSAVIRQFLSQGVHPSIGKGEPVAEYVLFSLTGTDQNDEWGQVLREQKLDANDVEFENLRQNDEVFKNMIIQLQRSAQDTRKGERMSSTRRALMELLELRAGEYLRSLGRPEEGNEKAWLQLLEKLR